jgi:hypothetical protein
MVRQLTHMIMVTALPQSLVMVRQLTHMTMATVQLRYIAMVQRLTLLLGMINNL